MQKRLCFLTLFFVACLTLHAQQQPVQNGQPSVLVPPGGKSPGNEDPFHTTRIGVRLTEPLHHTFINPIESTIQSYRVNSIVNLFDSSYFWRWDTLTGSWIYRQKFTYYYDAQYNRVNEVSFYWVGANFTESSRYLQTYDVNNNRINATEQHWNGLAWDNYRQTNYSYNATNNRVSQVGQNWISASWDNSYRYLTSYGVNNKPDTELFDRWVAGQWAFDQRYIYSYNGNNIIATYLRETWNGTGWDHAALTSYGFDPNNNPISVLSQNWNGVGWTNYSLQLSTFDSNNNMLSNILEIWNGSAWDSSSQVSWVYNANNQAITYMYQIWNGSAWVNNSYDHYGYDANGNQVSDLRQTWNGTSWQKRDSSFNYFTVITGLNEIPEGHPGFVAFPNPARDIAFIHGCPPLTQGSVSVCNRLGQIVLEKEWESGQTETTLNIKELSEGLYFIRVHGEAKSMAWQGTQRLVVSRR